MRIVCVLVHDQFSDRYFQDSASDHSVRMPLKTSFAETSFEELLLLCRHISRVSGFISLKTLGEYLPGVDMGTNVQLLESLMRSRHIQKVKPGYYAFMPSDFEVEAEEVESEHQAIANLKSRLINGNEKYFDELENPVRNEEPEVCLSSQTSNEELQNESNELRSFYAEKLQSLSLDNTAIFANGTEYDEGSTLERDMTERPRYPRGLKRTLDDARGVRFSTTQQSSGDPLLAMACSSTAAAELETPWTTSDPYLEPSVEESSCDMTYSSDMTPCDLVANMEAFHITPAEDSSYQERYFDASGEEITIAAIESGATTPPLDPSAPEFMPSSSPVEAISSAVEPQEVSQENALAAPETPRTHVDLLPPARKPRSVTFSPEVTSPASGHKNRGETGSKFHWTKKKTGDEVTDPCAAVEIFCRYNGLKPPSYNVIFMPRDNVYFCKLLVGTASFKSYPAMSRTKKRAMEVAAEEAVLSLGLTSSMIATFAKNQFRKFDRMEDISSC